MVTTSPRRVRAMRFALIGLLLLLTLGLPAAAPRPAGAAGSVYDWTQFNGDAQHSGNNTLETAISTANVGQLRQLYQVQLPPAPNGQSRVEDGAPVLLNNVSTAGGTRNLLFLTTKSGQIVALDAANGSLVWQQQPAFSCSNQNGNCITTSSPAIDPNHLYVYSYGLDGFVHKYTVGTGQEITGGGWPELATRKGVVEKGSSSLAIGTWNGTNYLYVANSGYFGDFGDYQGHLTTINLSTGAQHVFNALCSSQVDIHFALNSAPDCGQATAAIWGRPAVVFDAATGKIYLATGNGDFNPAAHDWGDTVFALNPDGTAASGGTPLDSYTPTNYSTLMSNDEDLGSSAPAIVTAPAGSSIANLGVQGGKDQKIRLLNLDNLSGQGSTGHTGGELQLLTVPQGGEVLGQPAAWTNPADGSSWLFVATTRNGDTASAGIAAYRVTASGGIPALSVQWYVSGTDTTSPLLANGVLYAAGYDYAQGTGVLRAYNPVTGAVLWQVPAPGGIHWQSPVVVDGVVFLPDNSGNLTAYTLPATPTTGTVSGTVSDAATSAPISGAAVSVDGTSLSTTTLADGSYTISNVPTGSQSLTASAAGYSGKSQSVSVTSGATSTLNFSLTPVSATGTVSGTVTDATTQQGIGGATVSVDGTNLSTTTQSNGSYSLSNVPSGSQSLTASATGYDSRSQSVAVTAGTTVTLNLALTPSASQGSALVLYQNSVAPGFNDNTFGYSSRNSCDSSTYVSAPCSYAIAYTAWGGLNFGVIGDNLNTSPYQTLEWDLNPNGLPITDFSALVSYASGGSTEIVLSASSITQGLGNGWVHIAVPVSQLNPRNLLLRNVQLKNATSRSLPTVHIDDVEFVGSSAGPSTGTVSGTVRDTSNIAIAGATVSVDGTGLSTTTQSNGSYSLSNVPAGSQSLTASATGYTSQSQNVTVVAGGTASANFNLNPSPPPPPATGTISGMISDANTQSGIGGATVGVDGTSLSTTTQSDGSYTLANVPAGGQSVTVSATGYTSQSRSVTVVASASTTLNVALAPDGSNSILILYDNSVAPGFHDNSFGYSSRNPCDTSTYVSAPCSYAIAYKAWGGLNFGVIGNNLNTSPYATLEWDLNPNGLPITDFSVLVSYASGGSTEIVLSARSVMQNLGNGWVHVSVPVSQLNPRNLLLRNVQLKNATNRKLSTVHIDDVEFVGP